MKKVIALLLALVMVFALCACGSSSSAPASSDSMNTLTEGRLSSLPQLCLLGELKSSLSMRQSYLRARARHS